MDTSRRTFLTAALGGVALWALRAAGAAENPAPAGDVVHLTLNVEGMH